MSRDRHELWQKALDDAQLVREVLSRIQQLALTDRVGAIAYVEEAMAALASLRLQATQSSALLGVVLFYGIELEVRLDGLDKIRSENLGAAIGDEIVRCDRLIATIASHLEQE